MKSIEEFFSDLERRGSLSARLSFNPRNHPSALPDAIREAANRGWKVFPWSMLAKATACPDLLLGEATSDLSRLEELAAEYPGCGWRVAAGPWSVCILQLDGQAGRNGFWSLSQEHGECHTLQAKRGDSASAFFRWPRGLQLRTSTKELITGVRILGEGEGCFIPSSAGCSYVNPWAEIEAVPCWLRELAFETPENPPGKALPVPAFSSRPPACRSRARVQKSTRAIRAGYSVHDQAGWHGQFRISRRR